MIKRNEVSIPTEWRIGFRRHKYFIKSGKRQKLYQKNKRFKDTITGTYVNKKTKGIMCLFYSSDFNKFLVKKENLLEKLVNVEKYFKKQVIIANKCEKIEPLPQGKEYSGYNTWEDIFGTLFHISDRYRSVHRLMWILNLIEMYKLGKLKNIPDFDIN